MVHDFACSIESWMHAGGWESTKSVKIIDVLEIQIFLWWSLYFQSQLL